MAKPKPLNQTNTLAYHRIGDTIRKYRKEKDLKLLDLAAKTQISSAMLSKIENGRMIPTIPSLFSIIYQLNIPADLFFKELTKESDFPGYFFIPKDSYKPYTKEEKAVGFSYLSILDHSMNAGSFQISLVELLPGSRRSHVTTEAFEYIYVVNGSIMYQLGKNIFNLNTGDSLFFDGNLPHLPINQTNEPATMLVVYFFSTSHS